MELRNDDGKSTRIVEVAKTRKIVVMRVKQRGQRARDWVHVVQYKKWHSM